MGEKKWYDPHKDAQFANPFIDTEETRHKGNIVFTYVHGGFKGTSLKFSFCFPEKENYQGRFYQYLSPFPGTNEEMASLEKNGNDDMVSFSLAHGAYFLETNMAAPEIFGIKPDPTIVYRSSAAAAEFSRTFTERLYRCARPYGYVFGGSGGSYKTFACVENCTAWDGSVPYVPGCHAALPNVIFVRGHALRVLRNKMDYILDAVRPGCPHGLYDGLTPVEADALREVTTMGYPPEAWLQYLFMGDGSLSVLSPQMRQIDPDYCRDYWEKPGYLGTEKSPAGELARKDRTQLHTSVTSVFAPTDVDIAAEKKKRQQITDEFDGRNGVDDA